MPAKIQSISDLRRQLKARRKAAGKLRAARAKLVRRVAALDKEIAAVVGAGRKVARRKKKAPRGRGRAKKALPRKRATGKPLAAYIRRILSKAGEGMRVKAIMGAVRKAGYRSSSKDFYGIVAKTLLDGEQYQRVKRGVYKLAK